MYKYIVSVAALLLLFLKATSQPAGWEVNASDFEYSASFTWQIDLGSSASIEDEDYVAAFVNEEIRGVVAALYHPTYSDYFFPILVYSDQASGETVTFKFYDASENTIETIEDAYTFELDHVSGSYEDPLIATLVSIGDPFDLTMSGEYTVGSTDADYSTINQALADYMSNTIVGDITFVLQAETFSEAISLEILNEEYHLTIRGEDRDATIIDASGTTGFFVNGRFAAIQIEEMENVTLENFTLNSGTIDDAIGIMESSSITLNQVNFSRVATNSDLTININLSDKVYIDDCDFAETAGMAVFTSNSDSIFVENSDFSEYTRHGIKTNGGTTIFIRNNVMESAASSDEDILLAHPGSVGIELSGNTIHGSVTLSCGDSFSSIHNNIIIGQDDIACALIPSGSCENGNISVYNNFFSSASNLGIYSEQLGFDRISFVNNTVISGGNPSVYNMFFVAENVLSDRTISSDLILLNNIFQGNSVAALDLVIQNSEESISVIDHNLIYSDVDGAVNIGYFSINGETIDAGAYTFAEWQAVYSGAYDQNSQSFAPSFVAADDFHITHGLNYRFGTFIDSLTVDFDGDIRIEGSVDVGADQYVCEESTSNTDVAVFNEYIWDGNVYDESGSYSNDYINSVGCDSTAIINLTILTLANEFTVEENIDDIVVNIAAIDGVSFSLASANDEALFTLTHDGLIFTSPPDFEDPMDLDENNTYVVEVIATDAVDNVSSVEVTIFITDIDEIAPEITSPSEILVAENTEGTFYTLTANEEVTFSLGAVKDEEWFNLDDGQLTFVNPADFEMPFDDGGDNNYFLDVIAKDIAGNISTTELIVSIVDVDETVVLGANESIEIIKVYPNPVVDQLFFSVSQELDIRVMTPNGKLVTKQKTNGSIDLSGLVKGFYLIEISKDDRKIIERIIKVN